jgi:hypothetical protein
MKIIREAHEWTPPTGGRDEFFEAAVAEIERYGREIPPDWDAMPTDADARAVTATWQKDLSTGGMAEINVIASDDGEINAFGTVEDADGAIDARWNRVDIINDINAFVIEIAAMNESARCREIADRILAGETISSALSMVRE